MVEMRRWILCQAGTLPEFTNFPIFEDQDVIGVLNRPQSMSNDDSRAVADKLADSLFYQVLRRRVQA